MHDFIAKVQNLAISVSAIWAFYATLFREKARLPTVESKKYLKNVNITTRNRFSDFSTDDCAKNRTFSVSNTVGWFFRDDEKSLYVGATLRACFVGLLWVQRGDNIKHIHILGAYKGATNAP